MNWGVRNTSGVSIPAELVFNQVSHCIAKKNILTDVSFVARSGTVTCLLGPSGSGKTTLLRLAAGMERLFLGRILQDGREMSSASICIPPEKRGIGFVFQNYALFPHLSVFKNVIFGLKHLGHSERKLQAMRMLERVGLLNRKDDYPHQLSGGEQQRIALARALAPRPGVLLMDEPFSSLDSRLRDTMREETLAILRETRATSIIVTHDSEEALRMGDKIILLQKGRLEQSGSGHDLYYHPRSLFAARFFSELNYFQGIVKYGQIMTPLGPVPVHGHGLKNGDMAMVVVRISSINIEPFSSLKPGEKYEIEGRVLNADFTGDHLYLRIGIPGYEQPLSVRVKEGTLPESVLNGTGRISLNLSLDGCFAFSTLK
ncbi:ABC transporter ATP-binding protein [Candidatus Endowatersipora endosymbiont of Watersipora subatra]|uniref:ABC transporter ATP-binding protein n=1 Tax=Candidatus Endowatersipora endosymbiont of Watersipora subatra TaxID=3077946 RepID=UPI00312C851D